MKLCDFRLGRGKKDWREWKTVLILIGMYSIYFINSFKLISQKKRKQSMKCRQTRGWLGMEVCPCGLLAHQHRYGVVDYSNYWWFCVVGMWWLRWGGEELGQTRGGLIILCNSVYLWIIMLENQFFLGSFLTGSKTFRSILHIWLEGITEPRWGNLIFLL